MNRSRLILIVTVLLVLGAGMVLGRVSARISGAVATEPPPPPPAGAKPHSWLADQLDLNSDQRQKMDAVWAETRQKMDESFDKRRTLDHDREQALLSLLDEEQRQQYDEILAVHRIARAELDKQREAIIRTANERSRALLSESQQQRWDTLTKDHPWHGGHGPGHPTTGPSTTPSARPGDRTGAPGFGPPPDVSSFEPLNSHTTHDPGGADASTPNQTRPSAPLPR